MLCVGRMSAKGCETQTMQLGRRERQRGALTMSVAAAGTQLAATRAAAVGTPRRKD